MYLFYNTYIYIYICISCQKRKKVSQYIPMKFTCLPITSTKKHINSHLKLPQEHRAHRGDRGDGCGTGASSAFLATGRKLWVRCQ